MGKTCFLLLVLLLAACAPIPATATATPTPFLIGERHANLTMVEFFGIT